MKLKAKALEEIINQEIDSLMDGAHGECTFAIHNYEGVQVKIVLTQREDRKCSKLHTRYEQADESMYVH